MRMHPVSVLILLHLLWFSHCYYTMDIASATTTKDTDKEALLALKESSGIPSDISSTWNKSIHFCKWKGVTCSHGRVSALDLSSGGLKGFISPFIGNLTFLRRLNLMSNDLRGEIPSSISRLNHLQFFYLSNNSLHGELTWLQNCSRLTEILVSTNQFGGKIPSWLSHLHKLKILDLSSNSFSDVVPRSLTNLSSLVELYLYENDLVGTIPNSLGHLSQIQVLYLHTNYLTGTIPHSLSNLTSLSDFSSSFNNLDGSLPPWIATNLQNLQYFYLNENQLTGEIPYSLANASKITELELNNNNFSGSIPAELGTLCPTELILFSNELEATVPKDWEFMNSLANCTRLSRLELSRNKLGGMIPNSLTNLSVQLQDLMLDNNYLSGPIPSGIGNLIGLKKLVFDENYLTGIIPESIGKLYNLHHFSLHGNRISGPIPSSIGNLTRLFLLWLHQNNLEGPIPPSIGKLKALSTMDFSDNALNGTLPTSIFNISSLSEDLSLENNFLVGTIPTEIGNLQMVGSIYLSANNLSGELPDALGSCGSLEYLALDNNKFIGKIPKSLSSLKGLCGIYLDNNSFSGNIPIELSKIFGLEELHASHNNLSGLIPEALENLTSLYVLDLSFNNLEGQVPTKGVFSNITGLSIEGNDRLCGGIHQLRLAACSSPHGRTVSHHSSLKVIIITVSLVLCFISLALAYVVQYIRAKFRKSKKKLTGTVSVLDEKYPKVSYRDMAEATENFSVSNLIGTGRYSRVYKGVLRFKGEGDSDPETHNVAIKVIDLQQLGSPKSFLAECEALRVIRHRNLIRIRTCCSTIDYKGDDFKALVFDYVPNGNLHRWLHPEIDGDGQVSLLSLTHRLNIAIDIADALKYLHHNCEPSVIHCDLKPSNILLREDLSACVSDFGLAKLLPDPISKSLVESESSILIRGSIGYVPPGEVLLLLDDLINTMKQLLVYMSN